MMCDIGLRRRKGLCLVWPCLLILLTFIWNFTDEKHPIWVNSRFNNNLNVYHEKKVAARFNIWKTSKELISKTNHTSGNIISVNSEGRINHSNRKKVLLISRGRSGSSFLGKLFDEDQKLLYLFEPLRSLASSAYPRNDTKSLKILDEIYGCQTVDNVYLDFLLKNEAFRLRSSRLLPFYQKCQLLPERACLAQLLKKRM